MQLCFEYFGSLAVLKFVDHFHWPNRTQIPTMALILQRNGRWWSKTGVRNSSKLSLISAMPGPLVPGSEQPRLERDRSQMVSDRPGGA